MEIFTKDLSGVVELLSGGGAELGEIFVEHSRSLSIVMDDGRIEKVLGGEDKGIGVRVVEGGRTRYGYTNQMSLSAAVELAKEVWGAAPGKPLALDSPRPGLSHQPITGVDEVDVSRKLELVRAVEAAARAVGPQVRQVRVTWQERLQRVRVASSAGVDVDDQRPYVVLAVHCVASEGEVLQTGYEVVGGLGGWELMEEQDPEGAARKAAERAVMMLRADPAPGGAMPVVISSSAGGTMIHEAVGHGLEADLVLEGMSVYAGKLGQQVASELVSVVDDGTLPGKRGSCAYDDEGWPTQRNLLIDRGILRGYMHERTTAARMGVAPTGNGRRESYRHWPIPRMTNTMILPGEDEPESIIRSTGEGLFVVKMGGGQVNTVTGDFVFEVAEGYLIRDGRIGPPVRGATLTGNGPRVLMEIDRVGNDLGFGLGTCGKDGQGVPVADAQPTIRVPSLVVGGLQS